MSCLKTFSLLVGVIVVVGFNYSDHRLFLLLVALLTGRTEGHRLRASIPGLTVPYLQDSAAALNSSRK